MSTYAGTAELERYMDYTSTTNPFSNTQMQEALDRSEAEVNKRTATVFVTGTDTTPAYIQKSEEKHTGRGYRDMVYLLKKYPLPDVSTTVSGTAVTADDTSVFVVNTQGFPTSGSIVIENDRIDYTGKSGSAFTGCTSVAAHGTATAVSPHVIEISTTDVGQTPSWIVLQADRDYDLDLSSGRVRLYESSLDVSATTTVSRFPYYQLPNRFRGSYISGWDEIPDTINRLCLMIASKDLMHSAVRKAHGGGMNEFNPSLIDVDEKWIEKTIAGYKSIKSVNI